MEIIIQIFKDFGVGILGAVFFTLFRLGPKFQKEGVDCKKLVGKNKMFWFWCVSIIFLVSIITNIASDEELKSIQYVTGFDFGGENLGFIILGMTISKGSEEIAGKKLNQTKKDIED